MIIAKQAAKVEVVIVIRATLDAWAAPYIIEQAAKVTPVNGSLTVTAEGVPERCDLDDIAASIAGDTPWDREHAQDHVDGSTNR